MNKQGNKSNPAGGIEYTHIFGPGTGFTVNPVRGCQHQCRWRMSDGQVAICYAEAQRDRLDGAGSFQNITFHPEVLDAIKKHKRPAGIFINSMSDLFGQGVCDAWIQAVMETIAACPQHTFFALTKNPTRLPAFFDPNRYGSVPKNLALGVSLPPTFMFGKELTLQQQQVWFNRALDCLSRCNATVRWVSLEPLSWDCSDLLAKYRDKLHWAVIGAASNGARTYQPDAATLCRVHTALNGLPIFYKGNLAPSIVGTPKVTPGDSRWRQEFPVLYKP